MSKETENTQAQAEADLDKIIENEDVPVKKKKTAKKKTTKKRGRPRKVKEPEANNIPPKFGFNHLGLREKVDYKFTENGSVDWKAMIPDEFVVISKSYLDEHQINPDEISEKEMSELKSAVAEKDLVILLGGFKYIAHFRGFLDLSYETIESREGYYAVKCKIIFRSTYENGGLPFNVEAVANASESNTNYPFNKFLESIAENRAFIRAVRSALNINIVGHDEVDGVLSDLSPNNAQFIEDNRTPTVQAALRSMVKEKNKSWEEFTALLKEKGFEGYNEDWKTFEDIPDSVATELMGKMTKMSN